MILKRETADKGSIDIKANIQKELMSNLKKKGIDILNIQVSLQDDKLSVAMQMGKPGAENVFNLWAYISRGR